MKVVDSELDRNIEKYFLFYSQDYDNKIYEKEGLYKKLSLKPITKEERSKRNIDSEKQTNNNNNYNKCDNNQNKHDTRNIRIKRNSEVKFNIERLKQKNLSALIPNIHNNSNVMSSLNYNNQDCYHSKLHDKTTIMNKNFSKIITNSAIFSSYLSSHYSKNTYDKIISSNTKNKYSSIDVNSMYNHNNNSSISVNGVVKYNKSFNSNSNNNLGYNDTQENKGFQMRLINGNKIRYSSVFNDIYGNSNSKENDKVINKNYIKGNNSANVSINNNNNDKGVDNSDYNKASNYKNNTNTFRSHNSKVINNTLTKISNTNINSNSNNSKALRDDYYKTNIRKKLSSIYEINNIKKEQQNKTNNQKRLLQSICNVNGYEQQSNKIEKNNKAALVLTNNKEDEELKSLQLIKNKLALKSNKESALGNYRKTNNLYNSMLLENNLIKSIISINDSKNSNSNSNVDSKFNDNIIIVHQFSSIESQTQLPIIENNDKKDIINMNNNSNDDNFLELPDLSYQEISNRFPQIIEYFSYSKHVKKTLSYFIEALRINKVEKQYLDFSSIIKRKKDILNKLYSIHTNELEENLNKQILLYTYKDLLSNSKNNKNSINTVNNANNKNQYNEDNNENSKSNNYTYYSQELDRVFYYQRLLDEFILNFSKIDINDNENGNSVDRFEEKINKKMLITSELNSIIELNNMRICFTANNDKSDSIYNYNNSNIKDEYLNKDFDIPVWCSLGLVFLSKEEIIELLAESFIIYSSKAIEGKLNVILNKKILYINLKTKLLNKQSYLVNKETQTIMRINEIKNISNNINSASIDKNNIIGGARNNTRTGTVNKTLIFGSKKESGKVVNKISNSNIMKSILLNSNNNNRFISSVNNNIDTLLSTNNKMLYNSQIKDNLSIIETTSSGNAETLNKLEDKNIEDRDASNTSYIDLSDKNKANNIRFCLLFTDIKKLSFDWIVKISNYEDSNTHDNENNGDCNIIGKHIELNVSITFPYVSVSKMISNSLVIDYFPSFFFLLELNQQDFNNWSEILIANLSNLKAFRKIVCSVLVNNRIIMYSELSNILNGTIKDEEDYNNESKHDNKNETINDTNNDNKDKDNSASNFKNIQYNDDNNAEKNSKNNNRYKTKTEIRSNSINLNDFIFKHKNEFSSDIEDIIYMLKYGNNENQIENYNREKKYFEADFLRKDYSTEDNEKQIPYFGFILSTNSECYHSNNQLNNFISDLDKNLIRTDLKNKEDSKIIYFTNKVVLVNLFNIIVCYENSNKNLSNRIISNAINHKSNDYSNYTSNHNSGNFYYNSNTNNAGNLNNLNLVSQNNLETYNISRANTKFNTNIYNQYYNNQNNSNSIINNESSNNKTQSFHRPNIKNNTLVLEKNKTSSYSNKINNISNIHSINNMNNLHRIDNYLNKANPDFFIYYLNYNLTLQLLLINNKIDISTSVIRIIKESLMKESKLERLDFYEEKHKKKYSNRVYRKKSVVDLDSKEISKPSFYFNIEESKKSKASLNESNNKISSNYNIISNQVDKPGNHLITAVSKDINNALTIMFKLLELDFSFITKSAELSEFLLTSKNFASNKHYKNSNIENNYSVNINSNVYNTNNTKSLSPTSKQKTNSFVFKSINNYNTSNTSNVSNVNYSNNSNNAYNCISDLLRLEDFISSYHIIIDEPLIKTITFTRKLKINNQQVYRDKLYEEDNKKNKNINIIDDLGNKEKIEIGDINNDNVDIERNITNAITDTELLENFYIENKINHVKINDVADTLALRNDSSCNFKSSQLIRKILSLVIKEE